MISLQFVKSLGEWVNDAVRGSLRIAMPANQHAFVGSNAPSSARVDIERVSAMTISRRCSKGQATVMFFALITIVGALGLTCDIIVPDSGDSKQSYTQAVSTSESADVANATGTTKPFLLR
jgi:hypothetical protein